jgi:hypothetical protein
VAILLLRQLHLPLATLARRVIVEPDAFEVTHGFLKMEGIHAI